MLCMKLSEGREYHKLYTISVIICTACTMRVNKVVVESQWSKRTYLYIHATWSGLYNLNNASTKVSVCRSYVILSAVFFFKHIFIFMLNLRTHTKWATTRSLQDRATAQVSDMIIFFSHFFVFLPTKRIHKTYFIYPSSHSIFTIFIYIFFYFACFFYFILLIFFVHFERQLNDNGRHEDEQHAHAHARARFRTHTMWSCLCVCVKTVFRSNSNKKRLQNVAATNNDDKEKIKKQSHTKMA